MEKIITNGTSGKFYINWIYNGKDRGFVLDSFAIKSIKFINKDDFEEFKAQHKRELDSGKIVIGTKSESALNKTLEKNEQKDFETLSGKANEQTGDTDLKLDKIDKNAKSEVKVKVS